MTLQQPLRTGERDSYSLLVLLVYSGLALTVFTYLTPPTFPLSQAAHLPVIGILTGDLPSYVLRFALTFVLFGLVPLALTYLPGLRRTDSGLVRAGGFLKTPLFVIMLVAAIVVGVLSAYSKGLATYYPYSHTLLLLAARQNGLFFVLHLVLYFVLYYIPWEIFFRGLLVLPFVRMIEEHFAAEGGRTPPYGMLLAVASFQILPSSLIHFGHPFSEMASAVLFGVLAGWLVLKTRSILPGLFLHAAVGLSLDTAILLRVLGLLPGGVPGWA